MPLPYHIEEKGREASPPQTNGQSGTNAWGFPFVCPFVSVSMSVCVWVCGSGCVGACVCVCLLLCLFVCLCLCGLLYTSDAVDDLDCVELGGRRSIVVNWLIFLLS